MTIPNILVCGAGSIGLRHISNLIDTGVNVSVWRSRKHLLNEISNKFSVTTYDDLDLAIKMSNAVVVATATDHHLEIATQVLLAKKALYIEKPISHNLDGINKLKSAAHLKIVEVGCQWRNHPCFLDLKNNLTTEKSGDVYSYRIAMGHRLDFWRNSTDYRFGYSSNSLRGGGALFDLIHTIDLAQWIIGPVSSVLCVQSKMSGLDISGDDLTQLVLTHQNGITGQIQIDMLSPIYRFNLEVISENGIFYWDINSNQLLLNSTSGSRVLSTAPKDWSRNDLFIKHISHFVNRLINSKIPAICSLDEGISALKIAVGAHLSATQGKKIMLKELS